MLNKNIHASYSKVDLHGEATRDNQTEYDRSLFWTAPKRAIGESRFVSDRLLANRKAVAAGQRRLQFTQQQRQLLVQSSELHGVGAS